MTDQDSQPSGAPRIDPRRADGAAAAPPPSDAPHDASSAENPRAAARQNPEAFFQPRGMTLRGAPVTAFLIVSMVAIELALLVAPELREWAFLRFAFGVVVQPDGLEATLGWPILTYAALHGGLLHLGFNMAALAIFGPPVERSMGSVSYLLVFLIAAAAGALTHFGWLLAMTALGFPPYDTLLVGASGAISAVLALEFWRRALLLWRLPAELRPAQPVAYLRSTSVAFILINVLITLLPGFISGEAHIGGFLVGLALAPLMLRRPAD